MKFFKVIGSIIPHLAIISVGSLIVLYIIQSCNNSLNLMDTDFAKGLIISLSVTSLISLVVFIVQHRRTK